MECGSEKVTEMETATEGMNGSQKTMAEPTDRAPCLDGFIVFHLDNKVTVPVSQATESRRARGWWSRYQKGGLHG